MPAANLSGSLSLAGLVLDVALSSPSNGQALIYSSGSSKWSNQGVVNTFNSRSGAVALGSGDVTGALGYTPLAGNQAITLSGDASGSGATGIAVTLATVNSNVGSFTTANITVDAKGRITAASSGAGGPSAANPTASVGLSAVPGSANTFMRSDAAPQLSQAIAPTMTGVWQFGPSARSAGSSPYFTLTSPADTTLTSGECIGVNLNLSTTRQFSTGNFAIQREMVIQAPTYSAVAASTITTAATLTITGAPNAGPNVTIPNPYALMVQSGNCSFGGNIALGSVLITQSTIQLGSTINIGTSGSYWTGSTGQYLWRTSPTGGIQDTGIVRTVAGNVGFTDGNATTYAALGSNGLFLTKMSAPSTPTGGGNVYVDLSGNLYYLSPGGTSTKLASN